MLIGLGIWWSSKPSPRTIVAVCAVANETGDPQFDRIATGFADSLTAELAGAKRVQVIGNADILRKGRIDQHLSAIHQQLGATFIVIGQIQKDSTGVRVLAHLLKMPEQTHVIVHRLDSPTLDNPLKVEADFALRATARFLDAIEYASHANLKH